MPAARQMLEPVMPQPMLNPMHPPLAKQLIALSIHSFGDGPLGWRYPGVLFGSLAIVAVYLCGLALFAAQGPAIAASLLAFFNQMLFVQSRIAMLDIFALTFSLFADRGVHAWLSKAAAASLVRARRDRLRPVDRLQMERAVRARGLHRHRRRDPPDARLAHAIRRRAAAKTGTGPISGPISGGGISRSASCSFRLRSISRRSFRSTVFGPGYSAGATADLQRQHHDRDRGPHLYEFVAVLAVPGAPGLVSVRQDRRRPDRCRRLSSAIR